MAKPAVPVDRAALERAVAQADPLAKNENDLWNKAAAIYNRDNPPISFSVVMLRVKSWGIPYRVSKGRVIKSEQPSRRPQASVEPSFSSTRSIVHTPAGEPPKALKRFSEEDIIEWANDIREAFAPKAISTNGLLYFLNNYFCSRNENREEFERIAEILRKMEESP